jgi:hypothetical protein
MFLKICFLSILPLATQLRATPPAKAEIFGRNPLLRRLHDLIDDIFEDALDGCRKIHIHLPDFRFGLSPRNAEQLLESLTGHGQARVVFELLQIEPERTIVFDVNELFQDQIFINGFTIGGQTHELIFPGVDFESREARERRVEEAQRMRENDPFQDVKLFALGLGHGQRVPFLDGIDGDDRSLFKG